MKQIMKFLTDPQKRKFVKCEIILEANSNPNVEQPYWINLSLENISANVIPECSMGSIFFNSSRRKVPLLFFFFFSFLSVVCRTASLRNQNICQFNLFRPMGLWPGKKWFIPSKSRNRHGKGKEKKKKKRRNHFNLDLSTTFLPCLVEVFMIFAFQEGNLVHFIWFYWLTKL